MLEDGQKSVILISILLLEDFFVSFVTRINGTSRSLLISILLLEDFFVSLKTTTEAKKKPL